MQRLIAPSLLSADFLHLEEDIRFVNAHADIIHLDIMDGIFVPNISFGFPVVEAVAGIAERPMDAHLMIVHPEKYVERCVSAGAGMVSFHLEAAQKNGTDPAGILQQISSLGAKAGIVVNPDIPAEGLYPYLRYADYVLIMSVFAGFGGQKFIEASYGKIAAVRAEILRQGLNCLIEVDGGVSADNAGALCAAGAEILVAGNAIFRASDRAGYISRLRGINP